MHEVATRIVEPGSAEEAAEGLREAWEQNAVVNIRGGGTKQDLGNLPEKLPTVTLSTLKLDRLVDYEPSDLTVTVQAGMRWDTLRQTLAARGQRLALDPPELPGATVGGVIASNVSGPKRLLYGTARDLVIGCQSVLADGSTGRSGGRVVKNVTGYDLHKLLTGSLGTLGLFTELAFKVMPLPEASHWLVVGYDRVEKAFAAARALARSSLSPAALEIVSGAGKKLPDPDLFDTPYLLFVAADGTEVAVRRQIREMATLCQKESVGGTYFSREFDSPADSEAVWNALRDQPVADPTCNLRLRWGSLLTGLPEAWHAAEELSAKLELNAVLQARAGTGLVYLYATLTGEKVGEAIELVQQSRNKARAKGGSLVIESAPAALKEKVEVWGEAAGSNSLSAMQAIKKSLDERNLLNPGKFLEGI